MKKAMRAAIGLAVSTAMTFGMTPSAHAFTALSSNILPHQLAILKMRTAM